MTLSELEMPPPPKGTVWVLRLDPRHDDATLWLFKRSRFTGRSNGSPVGCVSLKHPGWPMRARLSITEASIDEIVEAVVKAAHEVIREVEGEPDRRRAMQEALASELSRRLSIQVEVKR